MRTISTTLSSTLATILASATMFVAVAALGAENHQVSTDGSLILIQKDVGEERWAISYRLDDGYVTGNVFQSGSGDAAFLACSEEERTESTTKHDCHGAAPTGDWEFISSVDLPLSFWFPPGLTIPDNPHPLCGPGTLLEDGLCRCEEIASSECTKPLEDCVAELEVCHAALTETESCLGASFCDGSTTTWNGSVCVSSVAIPSGAQYCDAETTAWTGTACVSSVSIPTGDQYCDTETTAWTGTACVSSVSVPTGDQYCDSETTEWDGFACVATVSPAVPSSFCGTDTFWNGTHCVSTIVDPTLACASDQVFDPQLSACVLRPCEIPQIGDTIDEDGLFYAGGTLPGTWSAVHATGAGLSASRRDVASPTFDAIKDLCRDQVGLRDSEECADGYFWYRENCICQHRRHC